jgi:hypothetical protein
VGMGLRPCHDRPFYWLDDRENRVCSNREFSVSVRFRMRCVD